MILPYYPLGNGKVTGKLKLDWIPDAISAILHRRVTQRIVA